MTATQPMTRRRSRRASAPTVLCSGTRPGERRVLTVVGPGHIVPVEAERMDVALRGARESESVGCRMSCVLQHLRFGRTGIDPFHTLGRHVDQGRSLDRPAHATAIELDACRLNAEEFPDESR